MAADQLQKWNHFVPRFLLKRFAFRKGVVQEYRILVSHSSVRDWAEVPISKAAAHEHLYTFAREADDSDEVERWFAKNFEDAASDAIETVEQHLPFTNKEKIALGRLFGLQDLRTPLAYLKGKERFKRNGLPEIQRILQDLLETKMGSESLGGIQRTITPEADDKLFTMKVEVTPIASAGKVSVAAEVTYGRSMWLWSIQSMLRGNGKALQALSNHDWTILTAPDELEWFTCDNPAVKLGVDQLGRLHTRGGWGLPGNILLMPLSPRHLLFTQIGAKTLPAYSSVTYAQFELYQKLIAQNAYRCIYARTPSLLASSIRPRLIEPIAYAEEVEQWDNWHDGHSSIERSG